MNAYLISSLTPLEYNGIVRGYGEDVVHGVIVAADMDEAKAKATAAGFDCSETEYIPELIGPVLGAS